MPSTNGTSHPPAARTAELIFHGTGTSSCLPNISCLTAPPSEPHCMTCALGANPALAASTSVGVGPEEAARNRRRNTGAIFRFREEEKEVVIVIDAGKSFVQAAIEWFPKYGLRHIDGLLLTHAHADAMNGLDDLRCWTLRGAIQTHIDIYLSQRTFDEVQRTFPYLVDKGMATGGGDVPDFVWHIISEFEPVDVKGVRVVPLLLHHGRYFEPQSTLSLASPLPTRPDTPVSGPLRGSSGPGTPTHLGRNSPQTNGNGHGLAAFPFPNPLPKSLFAPAPAPSTSPGGANGAGTKPTATATPYPSLGFLLPHFLYLSDASDIPSQTLNWVAQLAPADAPSVLVVDCLRPKPHMSHFGLAQAVSAVRGFALPRSYLIGMTCGGGAEWITHKGWERVCEAVSAGRTVLDPAEWTGDQGERERCDETLALVERPGEGAPWLRPSFDGLRIVVRDGKVEDGAYD